MKNRLNWFAPKRGLQKGRRRRRTARIWWTGTTSRGTAYIGKSPGGKFCRGIFLREWRYLPRPGCAQLHKVVGKHVVVVDHLVVISDELDGVPGRVE